MTNFSASDEETLYLKAGRDTYKAEVRAEYVKLADAHARADEAKQRVPDALVIDLLPAGLELENQNLGQSAASLEDASSEVKEWQQAMQNATPKHQEFRGDRYVAAVDVNGYGTTHLLYLARAVTPGTYRVPPPQVESMYRPNWQAVGEAPAQLVVKGQ